MYHKSHTFHTHTHTYPILSHCALQFPLACLSPLSWQSLFFSFLCMILEIPEAPEPTESIMPRSYENSQLSPNHHLQTGEPTYQSLKTYPPSSYVPSPPARNNKSSIIPKVKLRTPRSNLSAVEQLGLKSPPSTKVNQNGGIPMCIAHIY